MKKGCIAAAFYLLFATLMVSDGLLHSSKIGLDIESLYTIKPWSEIGRIAPQSLNLSRSHEAFFIYPWFQYTLEHLKQGKIPLWTHLTGGGNPFMGNLSCACFYPLNLLGLIVPLTLFWSLAGLLKLWLGAILTYGLLRLYRLRFMSCLFGGLAFGFCGFQVCWLNHPYSNVILFLPALFLGAEFFMRRRDGAAVFLNALLIGLQFLGGSPEGSFLLCLSWALYILYRVRQEVELFSHEGLRLVFYAALTGFLGVALTAFQLLPFFEYLLNSHGLDLRLRGASDYLNGGPGRILTPFGFFLSLLFPLFVGAFIGLLQRKNTVFVGVWSGLLGGLCLIVSLRIAFWLGAKPHMLMQVLPELYGPAAGGCQTVGEISFSALNGGYAGVVTALLALYTLVAPCKRRPLPFFIFIFIFIFSFGAAHSIPWLTHILKAIPVLGWIHDSCLLSLTAFSIAVIAPFGLEDLLFRAAHIRGRSAAVMGVMAAVFVVATAITFSKWTFFETGVHLMEEEREPDSGILITEPLNGSIHTGVDPFYITGRATGEVEQLRAEMDELFVGEMRTTTRSEVPDWGRPDKDAHGKEIPDRFTREFTFAYPLDTLDEGTYKIQVQPSKMFDRSEEKPAGDWIDIRMVRPKTVTNKDLLVLCISCFVFLLLLLRWIPVPVRALGLFFVLAIDIYLFGMDFNHASPLEDVYPPTDVTDFLAREKGPFRIFTEGGIMYPNTNVIYGIEHMEWDDRLGVARYCNICDYIKLDYHAKPMQLTIYNFNLTHPLIDFMGVKYILVQSDLDLSELKRFKLVHDGSVRIYENVMARERAFIVGDWIMRDEINPDLLTQFDLREKPVLYKPPGIEKGGHGAVEIVDYGDDYVRLEVETEGQALLVLTDNDYPGWEARIDGAEVPILLTSGTFRAVTLREGGRHMVEFLYRPLSFHAGIYLSLGALLFCLLIAFIPFFTAPMHRRLEIKGGYVFPD